VRRFANRASQELATQLYGYYADYFLYRLSSLRSCLSALYKDLGTSSLSIRIMSAVTRSSIMGSDRPTIAESSVNVWAVFCPGSTSPVLLRPASKPSKFERPSLTYMLLIQAILRHSNVNVTLSYYIKPQTPDVIAAMGKFEAEIAAHNFRDSNGTVNPTLDAMPKSVN